MEHDIITCGNCGTSIMEGHGNWKCDGHNGCGWYYNAHTGKSGMPKSDKIKWDDVPKKGKKKIKVETKNIDEHIFHLKSALDILKEVNHNKRPDVETAGIEISWWIHELEKLK